MLLDGPTWLSMIHELWEQDAALENTACTQETLCRMNRLAMAAPGQAGWAVSLSRLYTVCIFHKQSTTQVHQNPGPTFLFYPNTNKILTCSFLSSGDIGDIREEWIFGLIFLKEAIKKCIPSKSIKFEKNLIFKPYYLLNDREI